VEANKETLISDHGDVRSYTACNFIPVCQKQEETTDWHPQQDPKASEETISIGAHQH